jgi:hypothetical protein
MAHAGESQRSIKMVLGLNKRQWKDIKEVIGPITFHRGKVYEVRGQRGTIQELIALLGIDTTYRMVCHRLTVKKMTPDQAFVDACSRYTYRGFTGRISEIIEHFGLDLRYNCANKRLSKGWDVDRVFSEKMRGK